MKKILLAEDDEFILSVYINHLKKEGYAVDVAKNGKIALEKIKSNLPDLVLLDINLPEIDGYQLLKMIREDKKTKDLKVIITSNVPPKEFSGDINELGVIKYFVKIESTPEEIVNTVKEVLK